MAEELCAQYGESLSAVTIVPSHGGVFVVESDGEELFSKKRQGRFPEVGEVGQLIAPMVNA